MMSVHAGHISIINELHYRMEELPRALSRIARYILTNPEKVIRHSLAEVALHSQSGQASVLRLVRELGFEGFSEFKIQLSAELARLPPLPATEHDAVHTVVAAVSRSAAADLEATEKLLIESKIAEVAERIRSSRRVHVFGTGLSGLSGEILNYRLVCGLAIAIPAAWAMAFVPTKRTNFPLLWMLSTKMLPAVGVLMPIYLICRDLGLLDSRTALIFLLMMGNLPIIVWMLFTYFREVPLEILESARMDGASPRAEIIYVLMPIAAPGIVSTALLNIVLAWNESFWTLLLTSSRAGTMSTLIASMSSPEGLFYAKLSAASTIAIAPVLILGWFCQRQVVRGLTFGAIR